MPTQRPKHTIGLTTSTMPIPAISHHSRKAASRANDGETLLATSKPNASFVHGLCDIRHGQAKDVLTRLPSGTVDLIFTSPPYNIGKSYERSTSLAAYLEQMNPIIRECHRVLSDHGSMCWQLGNYVHAGEVLPLDLEFVAMFRALGMKVRNRVVWTFGHGLHCSHRLSGRYETIVWVTKSDTYQFDLDAIRVAQKYPGKRHFKGPKKGQLSGNPLGKNPGDVWDIPNVKHNHPEKTAHPCQFPEALVERFVRALTAPGDLVLDPFAGAGTVGAVCNRHARHSLLIEKERAYVNIARQRLDEAAVREIGQHG
ncbi:DNA-methyltransferase [Neorhizobium galegae]|uniref:DNA-methyltransferase n=1 Tax=Neorhizobium galegae TaxID=399 RepID=UPI001F1E2151|nr:site-specific DNA-methyltransferase [Neorhizobium galegae]UIK08992.1 site-specific DNA-methyltransferase [Neorhizobium galegae]